MNVITACYRASLPRLVLGLALGAMTVDSALAAEPAPEGLPGVIRAAEFSAVGRRELDGAREVLRKAVDVLNRRLGQDGGNGEAWKTYLRVGALEKELAKGASADLKQLRRVGKQFVGPHRGLEKAVFTDVRGALATYAQAVQDLANAELRQEFERHIGGLAEAVEAHLAGSSLESWEQIAVHVGWFEQHGQAESVVRAVRGSLSRANLVIRVSQKVVDAYVGTSIDETGPVRDVILGTRIRGTGRTVGRVTASLVPDATRGLVQVEMIATNRAQTIGYNGPVRICQDNRTELHAWKQVAVGADGFESLPAESTASISSRVTGIGSKYRSRLLDGMTRRVGYRRMQKQQGQANRIAESHQRQRLNRQLDESVAAQLAGSYAELAEQYLHPLTRYDAFPRQFDTRSDENQLLITLQEAMAGQLGAPDAPPPLVASTDLAFHLHTSAVENYAAKVLAGRTFTAEQLSAASRRLSGDAAEKGARSSSQKVTITLTKVKPITLQIDDGVISLTIRGRRFVSRRQGYPPMNITLRYALRRVDGGLRATLLDEPEIAPPDGRQRLRGMEVSLRRLLKNHLEKELDKEIVFEGITLGGKLSALGRLSVVQLMADEGWLTLGCLQPQQTAKGEEGRGKSEE